MDGAPALPSIWAHATMPGLAPQEVDMKTRPTIKSIEIVEFEHEMTDIGAEPTIGIPI